jgi:hypothetical protein
VVCFKFKADGKTLGYCSTQPDSTGSCTCNQFFLLDSL